MARIVDSLKNFYKKQGGTPSDVRGIKSISGVIDKIANLSLGGGNNDFVVTYTAGEGDTYTADKTFAEISAAIEAGKNVKGLTNDGQGNVSLSVAKTFDNKIQFCGFIHSLNDGVLTVVALGIDIDINDEITAGFTTLANAQS